MKPDTQYVLGVQLGGGHAPERSVAELLHAIEATIQEESLEPRGRLVVAVRWETPPYGGH